jgi:hypothetical protein
VGLTTPPCNNLLSRNLTQNTWGGQSSTRTVAPRSKLVSKQVSNQSHRRRLTVQRWVMPPSSGRNFSMGLHGAISQMAAIFFNYFLYSLLFPLRNKYLVPYWIQGISFRARSSQQKTTTESCNDWGRTTQWQWHPCWSSDISRRTPTTNISNNSLKTNLLTEHTVVTRAKFNGDNKHGDKWQRWQEEVK